MAAKGLGVRGLTKRFGAATAVDDVSFDISEGEFVTLLGPSGCGKTTVLRMIAGFIAPDEGEVLFDGSPSNELPPHKRPTAMVFQSYALFPHKTVYENVRFGLRMARVPEAEQRDRVRDALRMVCLEGLEGRKPSQLSGGQQQRVALARAVVTRPHVLLFDEPLSNLDAKLRERVRVEIRELQRRLGITALYVTHDQVEALALSDRIFVMNRGSIEQDDVPRNVYRFPRNEFVADFIGLANTLGGRVVGEGGGYATIQSAIGSLRASARPAAPRGEVSICWRPEDMEILSRESPEVGNVIRGRILQSVYMGSLNDLFIDSLGTRIRAQLPKHCDYREGDDIALYLPPDSIHIMDGRAD
jgi:iron(III) transport system ATP-binding protein